QRRWGQVRTGVHSGRLTDRIHPDYRLLRLSFLFVGYMDRSSARRPADATATQRLRPHLDDRSAGVIFRDHDRDHPPHGTRHRDGGPGGVAGDLFSAAPERDGALLLRVTGPSVGACRRDGPDPHVQSTVPAAAVRWELRGPAGRTSRRVHCNRLVPGRKVDVLWREGWRQRTPLAPEVP